MKKLRTHTRVLMLACAAALAAGCAAPEDPASRPAAARAGGLQDPQFITTAVGNGRYEVQAARLAMYRAASPQVRSYAQMLIDHHTLANNELMDLVRLKPEVLHRYPLHSVQPEGARAEIACLHLAPSR